MIERARVVRVAETWLGTRYHHHAAVKGVGVDCATILVEVFTEAGLLKGIELPPYSPSWHLHRAEERYTDFIRQFAKEVEREPLPGDVVVWKFHRCFAHGAIVVRWPIVIHALLGVGCVEDNAEANQMLASVSENIPETRGTPRPMKVFSYWG